MGSETGWQRSEAVSLTRCCSLDETAWQRNKAVSLTSCWSWDETWLMRLPGKETKQCHSHSVGHGIRHDWSDCLAKNKNTITNILLIMRWDMIDATAQQRNKAVLLTYCWLLDEAWLMRLSRYKAVSLTYCWWWKMWLNETAKEIRQCHSHSVGQGMRHEKQSCITYLLLVMRWDMIAENAWQRNNAVSLTTCWSWMNHNWWDSLAKK